MLSIFINSTPKLYVIIIIKTRRITAHSARFPHPFISLSDYGTKFSNVSTDFVFFKEKCGKFCALPIVLAQISKIHTTNEKMN